MMFSEPRNKRRRRIGARESAAGIDDNSAEIGDNSAEIGNGAAGIVDIAKLRPEWRRSNSVPGRKNPEGPPMSCFHSQLVSQGCLVPIMRDNCL